MSDRLKEAARAVLEDASAPDNIGDMAVAREKLGALRAALDAEPNDPDSGLSQSGRQDEPSGSPVQQAADISVALSGSPSPTNEERATEINKQFGRCNAHQMNIIIENALTAAEARGLEQSLQAKPVARSWRTVGEAPFVRGYNRALAEWDAAIRALREG